MSMSMSMAYSIHPQNKNTHILTLIHPHETFLRSISHCNGASFSLFDSFVSMKFHGSLKKLKPKMLLSYNQTIRCLECLAKQQQYLLKHDGGGGLCFYSMEIQDIYMVDSWHFFCANPVWLAAKCHKSEEIVFRTPFIKGTLASPELNALNTLPCSISCHTFTYTLASLAMRLLFDTDGDANIEVIANTKLYWFLKRVLVDKERTFLII